MKRKLSELSNITDELDINISKKLVKEETIRTYCRMRNSGKVTGEHIYFTKDAFKVSEDGLKLLIDDHKSNTKSYNFTKIFPSNSDQIEIFHNVCIPVIDELVVNNKSALIFTFGLTNSGKTYTIIGDCVNPGILPLSMKYIFENSKYSNIYCNYVEIYNEDVFDLLAENKKKLTIKEREKVFYVNNIINKKIESIDDFSDALNSGLRKKIHASTSLNNNSSRSHTIFKIILQNQDKTISSISIVDLAGAERVHRAETQGIEFTQSCKINQSLSVLGKCFESLRYNSLYTNKKIVPFRESKLTMLFQEYFQGDQNICMIANINMNRDDYDETIRVLNYACTARDIKPVRSKIVSKHFMDIDDSISKISKKEDSIIYEANNFILEENEILRNQNNQLNDKYEEVIDENEELQDKNEYLLDVIDNMQKEFDMRLINTRIELIQKISQDIAISKFNSNSSHSTGYTQSLLRKGYNIPNPLYKEIKKVNEIEIQTEPARQNIQIITNSYLSICNPRPESYSMGTQTVLISNSIENGNSFEIIGDARKSKKKKNKTVKPIIEEQEIILETEDIQLVDNNESFQDFSTRINKNKKKQNGRNKKIEDDESTKDEIISEKVSYDKRTTYDALYENIENPDSEEELFKFATKNKKQTKKTKAKKSKK